MFIVLIWSDDIIFSTLNMNPLKKFQIEKNINYKILIDACIIDSDFEEL